MGEGDTDGAGGEQYRILGVMAEMGVVNVMMTVVMQEVLGLVLDQSSYYPFITGATAHPRQVGSHKLELPNKQTRANPGDQLGGGGVQPGRHEGQHRVQ